MNEWRDGVFGSFVMGLKHGWYCLGCCELLMGLLFVTGVMNPIWMAVLAIFVLIEKVTPVGIRISRVGGLVLVAGGLWLGLSILLA